MRKITEEPYKALQMIELFKKFNGVKYIPGLVKNIDVCIVNGKNNHHHLLWGEAKEGNTSFDLMLTQLVLTIYKATKGETILPPKVVCCFNSESIWFIPYHIIQRLLNTTDVDWTVTPSNYKTRGFQQLNKVVRQVIDSNNDINKFEFSANLAEIKKFAENRIYRNLDDVKIAITHNNFVAVFHKWEKAVLPHIKITNSQWKELGINKMLMPRDFFMSGLFVESGETCRDAIRRVRFNNGRYEVFEQFGMFLETNTFIGFDDGGKAATEFWNNYKRPPHKDYWSNIFSRIDLLVPQDIMERKGAYFTPQVWVEKAMEYLADTLGLNWQDEYYIWDCACGTGNLLVNLINPDKVFASTIDESDIRIIHGNIENGESNLHKGQVFRFDFLNDKIDKVPESLRVLLKDKEKRTKLLIFINPPYGEAANRKSLATGAKSKGGIEQTNQNELRADKFGGKAMKELYVQFLARIYVEFGGCIIGEFSKLKVLLAPDFAIFRKNFKAELKKCFIVPAYTFDNVDGKFPIGFKIWDTKSKKIFKDINADAFDKNGNAIGQKYIFSYDDKILISAMNETNKTSNSLFYMNTKSTDFQNQPLNYITNCKKEGGKWYYCESPKQAKRLLVELAVRHSVPATWLNDRDHFLNPADIWESDKAFQADCVVWGMLNNGINIELGENHLNPYTANEAGCQFAFGSKFGNELIISMELTEAGKAALNAGALMNRHYYKTNAGALMNRHYYKTNAGAKPGASIADIRRYFKKGKRNSSDETFNILNKDLTDKCNALQENVRLGTYKHKFLMDL